MKPLIYVDLEILAGDPDGEAMSAPVLAGAALEVLHGAFRRQPGRYALALPGVLMEEARIQNWTLRVVAGSRDDLDALVAAVADHAVVRDYARLGYPRLVPEAFSGPWIEYRRYRIPAQRSLRKPADTLRERRMEAAHEQKLPFFQTRSRSNEQFFRLFVQALEGTSGGAACQPDSYGLSVSSRPFAVPRL
ncbi:MAG: type I-F CRISPR-associated endoribonuclease Cas6/Csy4 [Candidatus Competibacteraceae bacterium]|nr:type I-F CRISPR-associated endoribonuclease Cas6/Csy4 [Candidatus Competibacteraceae bacterium]